eukprot:43733-Chlamydomonas_euryale.AAC.6
MPAHACVGCIVAAPQGRDALRLRPCPGMQRPRLRQRHVMLPQGLAQLRVGQGHAFVMRRDRGWLCSMSVRGMAWERVVTWLVSVHVGTWLGLVSEMGNV